MRTFLLLFSAVIALVLLPRARADSFEQFTATGTFLNEPFLALSGGFIVDETTGQVASVDFFYGTTELSLLGNAGVIPDVPDAFDIDSFDPLGDELRLFLAAPGNGGSLAGYTGGPLCDEFADKADTLILLVTGLACLWIVGQRHRFQWPKEEVYRRCLPSESKVAGRVGPPSPD